MGEACRILVLAAGLFLAVACAAWLGFFAAPHSARFGLACGAAALAGVAALSPRRAGVLLPCVAVLLALARGPVPRAPPGPISHGLQAPAPPVALAVQFSARVQAVSVSPWGTRHIVLHHLPGLPAGATLRMRSHFDGPIRPGALLSITARATQRASGWALDHAVWKAAPSATDRLGLLPRTTLAVDRWRSELSHRLQHALPPPHAGLARALLLGESSAAPAPQRQGYRALGLLHLLAISGMHFWIWDRLLRRALVRPLAFLRWPLLGLIALAAGFSAPVLRAGVALALRDACHARGLRIPAWSLWASALWIEVGRGTAPGLGLLLSYSATAGLLAATGRKSANTVLRVLLPSCAATLVTAPILHAWQATLEPWSIPLTPLFAALLPIRLIASAAALLPGLGMVAQHLLQASAAVEASALRWVQQLPAAPLLASAWAPAWVTCGCALLLACVLAQARWRARLLGLWLVTVLVLPASPSQGLRFGSAAGWVVAAAPEGSWILPVGSRPRLDARALDRELLPLLASLRAHGPWHGVQLSADQRALLSAWIPLRDADSPPPAKVSGLQVRALGKAPGGQALATLFSQGDRSWVVLHAQEPQALFRLSKQLPALRPDACA